MMFYDYKLEYRINGEDKTICMTDDSAEEFFPDIHKILNTDGFEYVHFTRSQTLLYYKKDAD